MLPVIFIIENNGLSCGTITASVCKVLHNLGDRAVAYGIPGENIDGMDVVEVYQTVNKAVKRARDGEGPTLINCKTFRHRGHFEGDIDIREETEIQDAISHDAVKEFEERMLKEGLITDEQIKSERERIQGMVDEAVEFARNSPTPKAEDAMKYVNQKTSLEKLATTFSVLFFLTAMACGGGGTSEYVPQSMEFTQYHSSFTDPSGAKVYYEIGSYNFTESLAMEFESAGIENLSVSTGIRCRCN